MGETIIYLVRHGRTRANEEERFSGRTAEPLLEQGRIQARETGKLLSKRPIAAIYTSPMVRTVETSRIMAGILGAPVMEEPGLAEIRIPQWDGRLKSDLMRDENSGYLLWKRDPAAFSLPGAETLVKLQRRAVKAIEAIAGRHSGEEVVAVTHLAVLRCLILYLTKRDFTRYRDIEVKNATPLVLKCNNTHLYLDGPLQ